MSELTEIQMTRRTGYPFFMVFAYPPSGPVIYTGDLGIIRDTCADQPTHHGWATCYRNGVALGRPRITLFGKGAYDFHKSHYLDLFRAERKTIFREKYFVGRPTFVLLDIEYQDKQHCRDDKIIRRYRRVPNKYLDELKEWDEKFATKLA